VNGGRGRNAAAKLRAAVGFGPDDPIIAETTPEGLLLRPVVTLPVEIYSEERVREFDAAEAELAKMLDRHLPNRSPGSTAAERRCGSFWMRTSSFRRRNLLVRSASCWPFSRRPATNAGSMATSSTKPAEISPPRLPRGARS
jgi:hypothetical protein